MRALIAAALVIGAAFFVPAAAACISPDDAISDMAILLPEAYLHDSGDFTANDGHVYYTQTFRADTATTDFLVIFDGGCMVDAIEVIKVPEEST